MRPFRFLHYPELEKTKIGKDHRLLDSCYDESILINTISFFMYRVTLRENAKQTANQPLDPSSNLRMIRLDLGSPKGAYRCRDSGGMRNCMYVLMNNELLH